MARVPPSVPCVTMALSRVCGAHMCGVRALLSVKILCRVGKMQDGNADASQSKGNPAPTASVLACAIPTPGLALRPTGQPAPALARPRTCRLVAREQALWALYAPLWFTHLWVLPSLPGPRPAASV